MTPLGGDRPFLVGGEWRRGGRSAELRSPWGNRPIGRFWMGGAQDLEDALRAAVAGFEATRRLPAHARAEILLRVAAGLGERREELARQLMEEAGKPIRLARMEVDRAGRTFRAAAEETGRIGAEWVPMDADPAGVNKVAFLRRFPLGVVAGITPFNFPLNLVAHKVAPAVAAGNALVLKPASQTPLSALSVAALVEAAGYPAGGLNVVPCPGEIAARLASDPRVRLLSFTGSAEVGWGLEAAARRKRVALELGGNAAVIVHRDGDWERAAERCAAGGFHYAGQSCISVQRIFAHEEVYDAFRGALLRRVSELAVGDPAREDVTVGPVISDADAERIVGWIREAVAGGARLLAGGGRDGTLVEPAILEDVEPAMKVSCREVFGPLVVLGRFRDLREAVARVNDSRFGLQAGIFTRDLGAIQIAHREIEVGGLLVNEVPTFRVDHMPYGGVKESGNTREGPRYALREMMESRLLIVHGPEP